MAHKDVRVPYTGDELIALLASIADKVEKEEGKGLSTEDFTTELKAYLESLKMGAGQFAEIDEELEKTNAAMASVLAFLSGYIGESTLASVLATYYTKEEADEKLGGKVDKVEGKGLSSNDYTDTEKAKLRDIEAGARKNVQADWSETSTWSDSYIRNKPTRLRAFTDDLGNNPVHTHRQYAMATDVYTKAEVLSLIEGVAGLEFKILPTLPEEGDKRVLYLIGPKGEGEDKYEEYIFTDDGFVKIGDTSINLADYYTKEEVDGLAHHAPIVYEINDTSTSRERIAEIYRAIVEYRDLPYEERWKRPLMVRLITGDESYYGMAERIGMAGSEMLLEGLGWSPEQGGVIMRMRINEDGEVVWKEHIRLLDENSPRGRECTEADILSLFAHGDFSVDFNDDFGTNI